MGKWTDMRGKIKTEDDDLTRGDAFVARRAEITGLSKDELTCAINNLRDRKAQLDAELSEINLEIDVHEAVLDRQLDAENLESIVANGYRWTRSPEPYPKVDDKEALRKWANETMPEALALHNGTLKALTKARLENGDAPPPGVSVWLKNTISRRRA